MDQGDRTRYYFGKDFIKRLAHAPAVNIPVLASVLGKLTRPTDSEVELMRTHAASVAAFLRSLRRYDTNHYVQLAIQLSCVFPSAVALLPFERVFFDPEFGCGCTPSQWRTVPWLVQQRARLLRFFLCLARRGLSLDYPLPLEVVVANVLPCVSLENVGGTFLK